MSSAEGRLIAFDQVGFAYGERQVFTDLSFDLDKSCRLTALTGPDGAGKSTLLKICAGILKPKAGTALVDGGEISYMSQSLGLYTELSVWENLNIQARLNNVNLDDPERMDYLRSLLERSDMWRFRERAAGALSGGMKQKLALCGAMSLRPQFLILDEPTVGVDPVSRQELWQLIFEYLDERPDARCLFSTAYLEECEKADAILMLREVGVMHKLTPAEGTDMMSGRTFALSVRDLKEESAEGRLPPNMAQLKKQICRGLQSALPSLLIDVSPRDGEIFLTTKEVQPEDVVRRAVREQGIPALHLEMPQGVMERIELASRTPSLEDAYIALNQRADGKGLAVSASFAGPPKFKTAQCVVQTQSLEKRFGTFTAVDHVSFAVERAEIFGLLGPNGAGKTTTFRMLCALLQPTSGQILINGLTLKKQKNAARAQIGYVSQKFSLYDKLTVSQNLFYFGRSYGLYGPGLRERIAKIAAEFALNEIMDTKAGEISFGQQRNLSMACALLHRPAILFLDEATSGADPLSRRLFWQRINALALAGTTVIVTTHFMEEAEYCDRFLIQDQGRMLFCGTPEELCAGVEGARKIEHGFIERVLASRASAKTGGSAK